ncbi:hypothetical protein [Leadbetterella byssophila]|jgi:uncharacterized protein with PQ loop repeat|uniref:Uncharacterized protein n=1 Tax=Leadbetterella byssophila (strain DSM 17132 / JCM 16389 / KACC 11308 / NBRC 106382 / 4M15) TaxID=649349 RepID=E4RUI8_LEAB4|nr:hypothetical protein [Leadbetterella byssophila]ADQ18724.1 hypothetical protein Lbys_3062 [Leadbetterella byssophila DSM 17132]
MLYLLILIIGAIASLIGPWWMLPLVAAIICAFKSQSGKQAFWISAAAGVSLWLGYSLILAFSGKENLIDKIAALFSANSSALASVPSLALVLFISFLVSGLSTGMAGLAGKHVRYLFTKGA